MGIALWDITSWEGATAMFLSTPCWVSQQREGLEARGVVKDADVEGHAHLRKKPVGGWLLVVGSLTYILNAHRSPFLTALSPPLLTALSPPSDRV